MMKPVDDVESQKIKSLREGNNDEIKNLEMNILDEGAMPYVNLTHVPSYYILSMFWFWKRKYLFLPLFFSLKERCYIISFLLFIFEIQSRGDLNPFNRFIKLYVP